MWMMPLHLHVNQKSDYDDMNNVHFSLTLIPPRLTLVTLNKNFKGILCMLSNISSLQIFFSITFIKIIFLDNISVSNRLDLDQPRRSDLGPNCLRRQY